jgi:hypothetical protein
MSVAEIIAELRKIPWEEQQKVMAYFDALKKEDGDKSNPETVSEEFKCAADGVFKTNDELFRKLAL